MTKLILIRGYPGSGKSTISVELEKAKLGVFIDHNKIIATIKSFVADDRGIYEEIHQLELAMTAKLLKQNQNVIVARGFGKSSTIEKYALLAEEVGAKFYLFTLSVPIEILEERVQNSNRTDNTYTNTPSALLEWTTDSPMQSYNGEVIIDGTKSIDDIEALIESSLNR